MIKKRNSLLIKKVKELNDNGYIILKNVIPKKLLNETKKFASEFLKCKPNSKDIIACMSLLEARDKKNFYNFCCQLGDVLPVVKTAYLKKISNIVEKIFKNKNIYLTDNCVFYNKAEVKRLQYDWHVEKSYFPNTNEVISLWYPWIHKVNEKNGTMIIAKKSNLFKNYDIKKKAKKNSLTQMKIKENELKKLKFLHCNLELGDCVLFNLRIAHKTGNNTSGIPRSTIIVQYTDFIGKFDSGWKK